MNTILLSEPIEEAAIKLLQGKAQIIVSPDASDATVGRLLEEADGLILRTATRVTKEMLQKARRLKVISRTGGGLNNVDVEAATDHRVVVCGVKGPQDRYVAEHAVLMMGNLSKHFPYLDAQTRKGNFKSRFEYRPIGLAGKRVGLIGVGRIGRIVADMCVKAFGMEVWAYDPYVQADSLKDKTIVLRPDMSEVIKTADFLSLHVPLTEETRGLMGREQLAMMKPTAFLINTSRGEIVQESALVDALSRSALAGAGLDVYEKEPPDAQNPLFRFENVILTPHTAALTKDGVIKLAEGAADNALRVLAGLKPSYSPNWEIVQAKPGSK
ncbi:MAG: NAD-binding D-isomer specific 2-hydroxyacid dehydrogenase [Deltaproteobacteria bacterium]|nr:NAD-binding D-isomer specific 2-hydroxyacid dehydrogenase [Deltaproteobacteria bacterium]